MQRYLTNVYRSHGQNRIVRFSRWIEEEHSAELRKRKQLVAPAPL